MFVVNFNEHVTFGLPESQLFFGFARRTGGRFEWRPATGKTALYDAILAGLARLEQSTLDKKVLIVISDGGDNASRHSLRQVLAAAARSNAIIYTIGLFDENDEDRHPAVLQEDRAGERRRSLSAGRAAARWCRFASASPRISATSTPSGMFLPGRQLDNTWHSIGSRPPARTAPSWWCGRARATSLRPRSAGGEAVKAMRMAQMAS